MSVRFSDPKIIGTIATLLIAGVGGYTNLLLELGELRAEVGYLERTITDLADDIDRCEDE